MDSRGAGDITTPHRIRVPGLELRATMQPARLEKHVVWHTGETLAHTDRSQNTPRAIAERSLFSCLTFSIMQKSSLPSQGKRARPACARFKHQPDLWGHLSDHSDRCLFRFDFRSPPLTGQSCQTPLCLAAGSWGRAMRLNIAPTSHTACSFILQSRTMLTNTDFESSDIILLHFIET
jgi:hypothetical protein